jgi:alginate O-acetyltransferase complex protein AlgI
VLFNSNIFIFVFLPIVLLGFYALSKQPNSYKKAWLVISSLFFYMWWNPSYLPILVLSVVVNYYLGRQVALSKDRKVSKRYLILGIVLNLAAICYYKYMGFFWDNFSSMLGFGVREFEVILPLAISFFTFQQIAYLVDCYKSKECEENFLNYSLFVVFFPQLIAGPIVHHKSILPQFHKPNFGMVEYTTIALGLSLFSIGLFKKIMLADHAANMANPVFDAVVAGEAVSFIQAWLGALSYTIQLYFDFSGYSDMALGIALLFGIALPRNFDSPYRSTSIVEFWRRWHMTLSSFLRDYLYIPLGGNKGGVLNKFKNLFITMFLGGLWHGAGWTFVIWGSLHGIYLIINNIWRSMLGERESSRVELVLYWLLTMLCVVVAWVFFRADSTVSALIILQSMFTYSTPGMGEEAQVTLLMFIILMVCALIPNAHNTILKTNQDEKPQFTFKQALYISMVLTISISNLNNESEFLYFNF